MTRTRYLFVLDILAGAFPCNSKANVFIPWLTEKSPIDCFSTQFVQPSIPRQNQHPKTSTENMHQNTQANVRNTVDIL